MKKKIKHDFIVNHVIFLLVINVKKTAIFELGLAEVGHVSKTFELRKVEF